MVSIANIIAQTGIDLSNPKLTEEVLAPALGDRLGTVIPAFKDAYQVITGVMNAAATLGAATSVAGGVGVMIAAVQSARSWLDGKVEAAFSTNLDRSTRAREDFVKTYYQLGSWSAVLQSGKCPSPSALKLNGGTDQYDPHYVWSLDKAVGKDRIVPTWRTPPYDGAADLPQYWGPGVAWPPEEARKVKDWRKKGWPAPARAPLSGYRNVRRMPLSPPPTLVDVQPPIPAIPEKYRDKYWGGAPGNGKLFENKYDTTLFEEGYAIPPGYNYLFSWGTYPYLSWSTNSEGYYSAGTTGGAAGKLDLSAAAAAIAAGIHSITPIHARISADDVARCYENWLLVSGIRDLPPIPKGQVTSGVYLDAQRLPWAPGDMGHVPLPLCQGGQDLTACEGKVSDPLRINGGFTQIHWRIARDIEMSFRSFFALRRALLFQWDLLPAEFRKAAAAAKSQKPDEPSGGDFTLAALANGVPLADIVAASNGVGLLADTWDRSDPVGLWAGAGAGKIKGKPTVGGFKTTGPSRRGGSGAIIAAGGLIVGGAAVAAMLWSSKRRKSARSLIP